MIHLLRHAQSHYNKHDTHLKQKHGQQTYRKTPQYFQFKFNKQYLDVDLTQRGIEQCLQARERMKDVHVDLVIVSPLRRALRTCDIVFGGHKSSPLVVVDPAFREVLSSAGDVGSMLMESQKEFVRFDFSLVTEPEHWYLSNIEDEEIKEELFRKIKDSSSPCRKEAAIEVTLQFMRNNFKRKLEKPQNEKGMNKKMLPSLQKQKEILRNLLQKHKSIVVVTHSENIKAHLGYKIKNCQVHQLTQDKITIVPQTQ